MSNTKNQVLKNEEGFALIITMLALLAITALGVVAMKDASMESEMARNVKFHTVTHTVTDGVVSGLMPEMVGDNVEKRGLDISPGDDVSGTTDVQLNVHVPNFYLNRESGVCLQNIPNSDTSTTPPGNDVAVSGMGDGRVTTIVRVYAETNLLPGNSILMPDGYSGAAKSLAGGGAAMDFTIRGLGNGLGNSRAMIASFYRHLI